jgi:hypothetical protein
MPFPDSVDPTQPVGDLVPTGNQSRSPGFVKVIIPLRKKRASIRLA